MAIHITQSHRIECLFDVLLSQLSAPMQQPLQLLKPQFFLVPSHGMGKWLEYRLAERRGISANVEWQPLRTFQWTLYQRVLGKERTSAAPQLLAMTWQIYRFLSQYLEQDLSQIQSDHPLAAVLKRVYHYGQSVQEFERQRTKQQDMLYWVSDNVARLFANYIIYRGQCVRGCEQQCRCTENWLAYWGRNEPLPVTRLVKCPDAHVLSQHPEMLAFAEAQAEELEAWQRYIWHEVFAHDFAKITALDHEFWQTLDDPLQRDQALKQLPPKIYLFSVLELPPTQLVFLRRLAQYLDIYVYHFNPSQEYWADSVDPKWKAQQELRRQLAQQNNVQQGAANPIAYDRHIEFRDSRHPLLTRLGKQARDIFAQLSQLAGGDEGDWQDIFPIEPAKHVLSYIQQEILNLEEPEAGQLALSDNDRSIQIHVCYSTLRQLEVLKEQLIDWLSQDSKRQAHDVLVLVPNLSDVEAHIRTVFSPSIDSDQPYLPIRIAGVSQRDALQVWQTLLGRYQLIHGRFSIEQFADWLSLPATQQLYALQFDQVKRITELLTLAGFKRGFDAQHLAQSLSPDDPDTRFSFAYALERLSLSIAIPQRAVFESVLAMPELRPEDFSLVGVLLQIYRDLDARRGALEHRGIEEQLTIEAWVEMLQKELDDFNQAEVVGLPLVQDAVLGFKRIIKITQSGDRQLPLQYVLAEIQDTLEHQTAKTEPTGHITFAQMGQLRPMPYELVVCLNLDMGLFPNRDSRIPFDLMDHLQGLLGDRSRLEDDQGAFLDAMLLARNAFWAFYNGFDSQDGEIREPSSILQELIDHLKFILAADASVAQIEKGGLQIPANLASLYHVHPLQPFDQIGFTETSATRYQDHWFDVACLLGDQQTQIQMWYEQQQAQASSSMTQQTDTTVQPALILSSTAWIRDLCFPARHFLRTHGIATGQRTEQLSNFEPLSLNGLEKYGVRDELLQQQLSVQSRSSPQTPLSPVLLQDQLPIGKMQHATWQLMQQEQQHLAARLNVHGSVTTLTTRRYYYNDAVHFDIEVPEDALATQWLSVSSSSSKKSRPLVLWLQYLLWRASSADDTKVLRRIHVYQNQTLAVTGLSQEQAMVYLADWLEIWQLAQQQPLFLPPALLADAGQDLKWDVDAEQRHYLSNFDKLEEKWLDRHFKTFAIDAQQNEACCKHLDWALLLGQKDPSSELNKAVEAHAYRLYAPLKEHVQVIEDV